MAKTFVIGDIHGAYRALRQCLERAEFDFQQDALICLGDVCDGWPETKRCVDELLKIQNLTLILGNHDLCALTWMSAGNVDDSWLAQGGLATINSYRSGLPEQHVRFFKRALPYFVQAKKLFVHAGIDTSKLLENQTLQTFLWDRTLAHIALDHYQKNVSQKFTAYDEIFIGHTPISAPVPIFASGVWLMDTGAGWSGVLSLMNIETKEVFSSDCVPDLYPEEKGRSANHF